MGWSVGGGIGGWEWAGRLGWMDRSKSVFPQSMHPTMLTATSHTQPNQVSALLAELAALRAADPGAKAVVFSSWGRLLRLVGDALEQVRAELAGAELAGWLARGR